MTIIDKIRNNTLFSIFYWAVRIGMALTFILSGARKWPGVKFTILPITTPIGGFFEAMYQTGFYWNFIGYAQIIIGILVFFNRTVILGTLLMMPVTINIFLISLALEMRGTPIITTLMLLGNIFMLMWYYENYLNIIDKPHFRKHQ